MGLHGMFKAKETQRSASWTLSNVPQATLWTFSIVLEGVLTCWEKPLPSGNGWTQNPLRTQENTSLLYVHSVHAHSQTLMQSMFWPLSVIAEGFQQFLLPSPQQFRPGISHKKDDFFFSILSCSFPFAVIWNRSPYFLKISFLWIHKPSWLTSAVWLWLLSLSRALLLLFSWQLYETF